MSPPTADSGNLRRHTPEETNGFHNGNAESSKTEVNSAAPPIPSSFRDAFIAVPPEILRRIVFSSAKGFSVGAGIKGGLALFAILARFARKKPPRKEIVVTNGEVIVAALKETLRYGLFLGTFAGTFVSMDEFIGAFGGHRRTARWRALFAGAVAGQSMLLTGLEAQHTSLAIYILMRAAVLASRCGIKSKRFGRICKPLTWKHGDIFLMCLSSSQILSAYILHQDSLPASYKSFLNKHGGKDAVILQGVKDIASGKAFTNLHAIEKYYKTVGVDVKLDPNMKVPCSIVHGNQSCGGHVISFLGQAYKRALPVYFPVYLIPALIVHRKGLLQRPFTILTKVLIGTARSSLFLSVYCTSAWMWTCFLFRIFKRCNIPMVAMGMFPPGLGLAIEKKSRRMEISLYCLARAIESFFTCIADAGYLPPSRRIKRADVVVFSLSTASMPQAPPSSSAEKTQDNSNAVGNTSPTGHLELNQGNRELFSSHHHPLIAILSQIPHPEPLHQFNSSLGNKLLHRLQSTTTFFTSQRPQQSTSTSHTLLSSTRLIQRFITKNDDHDKSR